MMGLSCSCNDYGDWWYYPPENYEPLRTRRGRRCCSCGDLVKVGALAVKFVREREPASDLEERIHGCEVPMRPMFMCERCGDLYFSLNELGYCITLGDDMRELVREYAEMHRERTVDTARALGEGR